jgi:hypothetical protein
MAKGNNKPSDDLGNLGEESSVSNTDKTAELLQTLLGKLEDQEREIAELKRQKGGQGNQDIAELAATLAAKMFKQQSDLQDIGNPLKFYSAEEIDPEDVLEDPIIFYSYGYGYVITDDKRNGKPIIPPVNKSIFFMHQATQKVRNGNHYDLYSYSTYPCYSKKEKEWLRAHSKYGIHFFETAKQAMEVNADIASRITKHINALASMEPAQIVTMYNKAGYPKSADITAMKNYLALEAVKKEIAADKDAQQHFFKDIFAKQLEVKTTFNP